jgi:hypothetical protein
MAVYIGDDFIEVQPTEVERFIDFTIRLFEALLFAWDN